jgi:hypothetical protein
MGLEDYTIDDRYLSLTRTPASTFALNSLCLGRTVSAGLKWAVASFAQKEKILAAKSVSAL